MMAVGAFMAFPVPFEYSFSTILGARRVPTLPALDIKTGYSAPKTDVEARSLLLKAWKDNQTRELAEIQIIDVRDTAEVKKSWDDFIVRTHGGASSDHKYTLFMRHPRRSCEAFAFATLQQNPWREDQFPEAQTIAELETWVRPLINEEKSGKLSGKPHH
jgi:hypothetical protein